jgi:exonuclease III
MALRRGPSWERWDAAERGVLSGLAAFDLPDVFRSLHGYDVVESSWYWPALGRAVGRRFDHVFASARLGAIEFRYLHELRDQALSDHAPVAVVFTPQIEA